MRDAAALRGDARLPPDCSIELAHPCPVSLYRHLYALVGRAHHWVDRDRWTDDELAAHLGRDDVRVWVLRCDDRPAGYAELLRHTDGSVELAYFGIGAASHGRGLGRALLVHAVRDAWSLAPTRVWLHTCTLDGPAARPNYEARGFVAYHTETYQQEV
jgi:GNAT superfamily N-acetyltransferase